MKRPVQSATKLMVRKAPRYGLRSPRKPETRQRRVQVATQLLTSKPRVVVDAADAANLAESLASPANPAKSAVNLAKARKPSAAAEDAAENNTIKLINRLRNEIEEGADFSILARRFSMDPSSKNGGSLGWKELSQFSNTIRLQLQKTQLGAVTEPIKLDKGVSIFKIEIVLPVVISITSILPFDKDR